MMMMMMMMVMMMMMMMIMMMIMMMMMTTMRAVAHFTAILMTPAEFIRTFFFVSLPVQSSKVTVTLFSPVQDEEIH